MNAAAAGAPASELWRHTPVVHNSASKLRHPTTVYLRLFQAGVIAAATAALATTIAAAPASATISSGALIDGPSSAIRELGGSAISSDGSGGLVYRKDVDGRPHIFAAQFIDGRWLPAQQVDVGQRFESSWPVIGAGNDGRLVVVWVQEFGASDRLFSATLQPGSRRFEAPVPLDLFVGDSALGTYPAISMAAGGQAYVVYRVVTESSPTSAPPGNVLGEYRVARYNGQLWSSLGAPINRSLASAQPTPTARNRPQIGTDQLGNAVVAWQELDDEFIPRIFARRVFASATGIALQVSPRSLDGKIVRAGADEFALAVGRSGESAIAWRQLPADNGAFTRPRVLLSLSPDVYSAEAIGFGVPRAVDGGGSNGPEARPGSIFTSIVGAATMTSFSSGLGANSTAATDTDIGTTIRLDAGDSTTAADPRGVIGNSGAAAFAWKRNSGVSGRVMMREQRADGVETDRSLSAPKGGQIDSLMLAGTGLGDGLGAFSQGTGAGRQIVAGVIDAPPDVFNVQTPIDFVRSRTVRIEWDPAQNAIGRVKYSVMVDDELVAEEIKGLQYSLKTSSVESGTRTITVIATDEAGQETTSVPGILKLDRSAPKVSLRKSGRKLTVSISDGQAKKSSGLASSTTQINFGDGSRSSRRGSVKHRYRASGRYRVTVTAADEIGNRRTLRRWVVIR